jgi:spore coat polysaccharide biosynthesis protein SpsF (cytidylyltransferase family)
MSDKTVACIIARTNSRRLPEKVLKPIAGKLMIEHIFERVKKVRNIDEIYICTSTHPDDQRLESIANKNGIKFYAGSEDSVIDRMLDVTKLENATNVIRVTGDNIFTDSVYLELMVHYHMSTKADYTRTEYLPIGIASEVIKVDALKDCYQSMNPDYSQYLLLYMFNPVKYKCTVLIPDLSHQKKSWSMTVDNPGDWERTQKVFSEFDRFINYSDLISLGEKGLLPNIEYGSTGLVKFPAGLTLYFSTFRHEIDLRVNASNTIQISKQDYEKTLNAQ